MLLIGETFSFCSCIFIFNEFHTHKRTNTQTTRLSFNNNLLNQVQITIKNAQDNLYKTTFFPTQKEAVFYMIVNDLGRYHYKGNCDFVSKYSAVKPYG
jgi:hypothetical protein